MEKNSLETQFANLYGKMLDKSGNKENRDTLIETYNRRMLAHKNIRCLLKLVKNSTESEYDDSLIHASCFLLTFEGTYVPMIDSIIFLLVLDGHDLFDPLREKYAHSFEQLSPIDISIKFKFLKEHEFEGLIRQDDSELRNKIAHHSFQISGKNMITIKGTQYNIDDRLKGLLRFTRDICKPYVKALQKESEFRGIYPSKGV
jgi:hypothetical protein